MFAQLGSIPFQGLNGFTQFQESRSTNIAQHQRIEGKPRLQRVGSNLHELKITIMLHASFVNPETAFSTLDDVRESAEVLPLILANGVYVGDYVIESIDRDVLQTDATSNIIGMSVSMSLIEAYNPTPQKRLADAAKLNAYATSDGQQQPLRIIRPIPLTTAQSIAQDVQRIKMDTDLVPVEVRRCELLPSEKPYLSGKIGERLSRIDQRVLRLQMAVNDPTLADIVGGLPSTLPFVGSAANALLAILPIDANLEEVNLVAAQLSNTVANMVSAAGTLKNAVITRRF